MATKPKLCRLADCKTREDLLPRIQEGQLSVGRYFSAVKHLFHFKQHRPDAIEVSVWYCSGYYQDACTRWI